MKTFSIDFEYKNSQEEFLELVCVAITYRDSKGKENTGAFWLHNNDTMKKRVLDKIRGLVKKGYTMLCHYGPAEGRSLLSLGMSQNELMDITTLDTYVLWRQIQRTDSAFGWYYNTEEGMWIHSVPPKFNRFNELEKEHGFTYENEDGEIVTIKNIKCKRAGMGLMDMMVNLFHDDWKQNGDLDTITESIIQEDKSYYRNLILNTENYSKSDKKVILEYCLSDIKYLKPAVHRLLKIHKERQRNTPLSTIVKEFHKHSRWCLVNAIIENNGMPFNKERFLNLSDNHQTIQENLCKEMNKVWTIFEWQKVKWVEKQYNFENLVKSVGVYDTYPKSEKTGNCKRDQNTLKKYDHIHQIKVYRETKKSINQLRTLKNKSLIENCDNKGKIRVMLSPYGSNTGRNQPSIKRGWIWGMSKWLRSLLDNETDSVIIGADYSSQEVSIMAHVAKDNNLAEAYRSNDPYAWFAEKCGFDPKEDRNLFKTLMLAIGYGQGKKSLGDILTVCLLGKMSPEEKDVVEKSLVDDDYKKEARQIINKYTVTAYNKSLKMTNDYYYNLYYNTFTGVQKYRKSIVKEFDIRKCIKTIGGWPSYHFLNKNAIPNFQIQGAGSDILKVAAEICIRKGLKVCSTLHDAVYIECLDRNDKVEIERQKRLLEWCMHEAVIDTLGSDIIRVKADTYETRWDIAETDFTEGDKNQDDMLKTYIKYTKNKNIFD